jgi:hypothetical protein
MTPGAMTCPMGTVCCVTAGVPSCATTCGADGGFIAACRNPNDCSGNPCCITSSNGYHVDSVLCAQSPSECVPQVDPQSGAGKDRGCSSSADCTAGAAPDMMLQLPDCCTNTSTNQKICFNKLLLGLVSGFTCP